MEKNVRPRFQLNYVSYNYEFVYFCTYNLLFYFHLFFVQFYYTFILIQYYVYSSKTIQIVLITSIVVFN